MWLPTKCDVCNRTFPMTIIIDESGKAVCSCPYCDGRLKVMNLEEVKTRWNSLKNKEAELEKELESNRKEQFVFIKKARDEGFYWQDGEFRRN